MARSVVVAGAVFALATLSFVACGRGGDARRAIGSGCTGSRQIALTFDDGPNPPYTRRILDILATRNARATFFVTGAKTDANPGVVADIEQRGMAVGAHSYGHDRGLEVLTSTDFTKDLVRTDASIQSAGVTTRLFRTPFGVWSKTMLRALQDDGYTAIGWSIDSRDWSAETTPDEIVANVLGPAQPGAIVLMHDGGLSGGDPDRSRTIAALPRIIDALQDDGYELVTVPEIAGISQAGPAAHEPRCD